VAGAKFDAANAMPGALKSKSRKCLEIQRFRFRPLNTRPALPADRHYFHGDATRLVTTTHASLAPRFLLDHLRRATYVARLHSIARTDNPSPHTFRLLSLSVPLLCRHSRDCSSEAVACRALSR
jgi:hypothetical protein